MAQKIPDIPLPTEEVEIPYKEEETKTLDNKADHNGNTVAAGTVIQDKSESQSPPILDPY